MSDADTVDYVRAEIGRLLDEQGPDRSPPTATPERH